MSLFCHCFARPSCLCHWETGTPSLFYSYAAHPRPVPLSMLVIRYINTSPSRLCYPFIVVHLLTRFCCPSNSYCKNTSLTCFRLHLSFTVKLFNKEIKLSVSLPTCVNDSLHVQSWQLVPDLSIHIRLVKDYLPRLYHFLHKRNLPLRYPIP